MLWNAYFVKREVEHRNELVVNYGHLAHSHAARLSRKLPAQVSYDEICSAAFDGLIEAVESFDPSRNAKFETFCQQRISGAVMDWLRSLDPQSRTVRTFERRRTEARDQFFTEVGRAPTSPEMAKRMGVSLSKYNQLCRLSQLGREVHFSAMEADQDNPGRGPGRSWDVSDANQPDPTRTVARDLLTEYISKYLSRDERLVIMLYYFEEMTMAEIGVTLNLSESRVSQIHKEILGRLRVRFGEYLTDDLFA
jgi:RNA polymerase sigma factor for flagellar operon FliA